MVAIWTLFLTKMLQNHTHWHCTYLYCLPGDHSHPRGHASSRGQSTNLAIFFLYNILSKIFIRSTFIGRLSTKLSIAWSPKDFNNRLFNLTVVIKLKIIFRDRSTIVKIPAADSTQICDLWADFQNMSPNDHINVLLNIYLLRACIDPGITVFSM